MYVKGQYSSREGMCRMARDRILGWSCGPSEPRALQPSPGGAAQLHGAMLWTVMVRGVLLVPGCQNRQHAAVYSSPLYISLPEGLLPLTHPEKGKAQGDWIYTWIYILHIHVRELKHLSVGSPTWAAVSGCAGVPQVPRLVRRGPQSVACSAYQAMQGGQATKGCQ